MATTILRALTVPEIRKKLAFTALLLALYRLGSHLPVPGVNIEAVEEIQSQFGGSNILGFLNLFSGGGLSRIAVFALGIMPYITASIILQLLQVVVPLWPSSFRASNRGMTTVSSWMMMLAVMYGMMPSAKTDSWRSAPPLNRLISARPPEASALAMHVRTFG